MDLSLEIVSDVNRIVSYDDLNIVISTPDGKESRVNTRDLILTPHQITISRPIDISHPQDIDYLLQLSPEIILISTKKK